MSPTSATSSIWIYPTSLMSMCTALDARDVQVKGESPLLSAMRTKVSICVASRRRFVRTSLLMRTNLSTPKRLGHARATRRPRSSRIVAVAAASLAMANPMATARMANQISSPMVHAMAGVQVVAEAVNNASTRPATAFGPAASFV